MQRNKFLADQYNIQTLAVFMLIFFVIIFWLVFEFELPNYEDLSEKESHYEARRFTGHFSLQLRPSRVSPLGW